MLTFTRYEYEMLKARREVSPEKLEIRRLQDQGLEEGKGLGAIFASIRGWLSGTKLSRSLGSVRLFHQTDLTPQE